MHEQPQIPQYKLTLNLASVGNYPLADTHSWLKMNIQRSWCVARYTLRPISQEFFFIPKIEKRPETRENAVSQEFQNNSKQFQNSKMSSKRETPPPPLPPRFGHPCNNKFTQPCVRSLNSDPLGRRSNKFTRGGRCKRFGQTRQRAGTGLWDTRWPCWETHGQ